MLARLGFLLLLAPAARPAAPQVDGARGVEPGLSEVRALCAEGELERALELAERRLGRLESASWVRREACERTLDFLVEALALDGEARSLLAGSERLTRESFELYDAGDRDAAYAAGTQAVRIREELLGPLHPDLIAQHLSLERMLAYERPESAVRHARRALELCDERFERDHPFEALALLREAEWALGHADNALAEARLGRARSILLAFEPGARGLEEGLHCTGPDALFEVENALGVLYRRTGRRALAEQHFASAYAVGLEALGADHVALARLQGNIAVLRMYGGDFASAEPLLRGAIPVLVEAYGPDHPATLQARTQLGQLLSETGAHEESERMLREVLERFLATLGPDHPRSAHARTALAGVLRRSGELEEAIELFEAALPVFEQLDLRMDLRQTREGLAGAHWKSGSFDRAYALFVELLDEFADEPADRAQVLSNLAGIQAARGEREDALELVRESQVLYSELGLAEHPAQLANMRIEARLLESLGAPEDARDSYGRATETFEVARLRAGEGLERATFRDSPYPELATFLARHGDMQGAWNAAEKARGRVLGDLLLAAGHDLPVDADWRLARESLNPGEAMLGWVKPEDVDATWGWVLTPDSPPLFLHLAHAESADPRDLAREFAAAARAVWVPDPGTTRALAEAVGAAWIAPLVDAARQRSEGPLRHLVLVPAGAMSGVPAEALLVDGQPLAEELSITYVPSATLHAGLAGGATAQAQPAPEPMSALVVGDPPFREEHVAAMRAEEARAPDSPASRQARTSSPAFVPRALPRLAYTRREAQRVAERFSSALVLLGLEASETRIDELAANGQLEEFDVLHFATHAHADLVRPERCELVVSQVGLPDAVSAAVDGRSVPDGRITVAEILATWHLEADLVTLSACETAAGPDVPGEGAVGLAHALLRVGASSVLVSLWSVDDRATALVMDRFYELLLTPDQGRRRTRSEALREARLWLRAWTDEAGQTPFDHPAIWSAFVLVGAG